MLEAIDNTNLFEGLTALGSVDNSNKSALSLKNRTGKEENAVNGHSLHKFSDAECAIFQYNPSGRGGFLPLLR
ncbi:MAG: hypothetical protein Q4B95_06470 [Lonepinella koalarum]|nr:hypothetical protein [Lonepinella koalarum]